MEAIRPREILKFIDLLNTLKHMPRRGWVVRKVSNPESIASHMYAMGLMTFILGNNSTLDNMKCLQLALVHDLAESIVGDIIPTDNIPTERKHQMEDKAMQELTSHLDKDSGSLLYNLYKEYEAKQTPEAKFVKELDFFDMLYTAVYYEKTDKNHDSLREFFQATQGKFHHPLIKSLAEELLNSHGEKRKFTKWLFALNQMSCEIT